MERTSSSSLLCAFLYVLYVKRILQHTVLLCIVSIDSIFSLALSMVNRKEVGVYSMQYLIFENNSF